MKGAAVDLAIHYQAVLPIGLTIKGDELFGSSKCGHVFRVLDSRIDTKSPLYRIVRFLDDPDGSASWRQPMLERAQKLAGLSLPYVSALREVGFSDGLIYLVHDDHPFSLPAVAEARDGLRPPIVLQIAEQLLRGLAALHAREISHGDLRGTNVFLSEEPGASWFSGEACIADTAVGDLIHRPPPTASQNRPAQYFPSEWNGKPRTPSPKADLYFLGVLLCETLVGKTVVDDAHQSASEARLSLWALLAPQLRRRGVKGKLHDLLKMLLDDQQDRPASGGDVLKRLEDQRKKGRWRERACFVAGIILVLAGGIWIGQHLPRKIEPPPPPIKPPPPERTPSPPPPDPPADAKAKSEAEKKWRDCLPPDINPTMDLQSVKTLYEELRASKEPGTKNQAEFVRQWWSHYRELDNRHVGIWSGADSVIDALFKKARDVPSDEIAWDAAKSRLEHLNEAARIWNDWAQSKEKIEDLEGHIPGHDPSVAERLRHWLDEIRKEKSWKFTWVDSSVPDKCKNWRTLSVHDGSRWQSLDDSLSDGEKSHKYVNKDKNELDLKWSAGEPIRILLECDRNYLLGGVRQNRIDDSIEGPLALWRLNLRGASSDTEGNFQVTYRIEHCPGPPHELFPSPENQINLGGK